MKRLLLVLATVLTLGLTYTTANAIDVEKYPNMNAQYSEIMRNPGNFKNKKASFTGTVLQDPEKDDDVYSVLIDLNGDGSSALVEIMYSDSSTTGGRLLEGDSVTVYGKLSDDTIDYETVDGDSNTVPLLFVKQIDR